MRRAFDLLPAAFDRLRVPALALVPALAFLLPLAFVPALPFVPALAFLLAWAFVPALPFVPAPAFLLAWAFVPALAFVPLARELARDLLRVLPLL